MRYRAALSTCLLIVICFAADTALGTNLVHDTDTLSQARLGLSATAVGNKAFFAGGQVSEGNNFSDVVDIYDADTGLWSTETLSGARFRMAATTVGNKAFFAGGYGTSVDDQFINFRDTVDIYDADTGLWSRGTLSQGRDSLAATTVGSKVIFAGGHYCTFSGGDYESDVVDIYDTDTGLWSTARLSQARESLAATTVGNKALFAGGYPYTSIVDIYDADTGLWSTANLSQPRGWLAAVTVGNKAIFAGGLSANASDVVDIYDADTGQWSTAALSEPRDFLSATVVGNLAIFAGGNHFGPVNVVDVYDADADNWYVAPALSESRYDMSGTTVGDAAMFAGGRIWCLGLCTTSAVDIYYVPEPTALSLLALGGLALLRRRRG
jgi:hypothetical protein